MPLTARSARSLRRAIVDAQARCDKPLVVATALPTVQILKQFDAVIYDAHMVEGASLRRTVVADRGLRATVLRFEAGLVERREREIVSRSFLTLATNPQDAEDLSRLCPQARARVIVVQNGVSGLSCEDNQPTFRESLLYIGSPDYRPNAAAIAEVAEEILPLLPGYSLTVTGALNNPPTDHPGVTYLGFVDDLASECSRHLALILPLRSGGGTRLKVLNAMAYSLPVISTGFGVYGLDLEPGVHYLDADSPDEFAEQTKRLRNAANRSRLISAARKQVETHYTWQQTVRPLLELLP